MLENRRGWPADRFAPSEVALLKAAGSLDAQEATRAFREYRALVAEGDEPIGEARLLPAVCRNLSAHGEAPDAALKRAAAASMGAAARFASATAAALRALDDASVPALALKGAALREGFYQGSGARPMSDIDILVPEARIEDALTALEGAGWRGGADRRWLATPSHAGTLRSSSGLSLDLHRHALYEARFREANDLFFAHSVPVEIEGVKARRMGASDQLLHSLVHGLRWSIARSPIWVLDAAMILRSREVEAAAVAERARFLRLTWAMLEGLRIAGAILDLGPDASAVRRALEANRVGALERLEHGSRVSEPGGRLGALPNLWFAYERSVSSGRPPLAGFPSFLRKAWGLPADRSLTGLLWTKALKRLRGRAARGA